MITRTKLQKVFNTLMTRTFTLPATVKRNAQRANDLNQTLKVIGSWSSSSKLVLNPKKTKDMIVSTDQIARVHNLKDVHSNLEINGTRLEGVF